MLAHTPPNIIYIIYNWSWPIKRVLFVRMQHGDKGFYTVRRRTTVLSDLSPDESPAGQLALRGSRCWYVLKRDTARVCDVKGLVISQTRVIIVYVKSSSTAPEKNTREKKKVRLVFNFFGATLSPIARYHTAARTEKYKRINCTRPARDDIVTVRGIHKGNRHISPSVGR